MWKWILIFSATILFPLSVFATYGACSYHKGVNCAAGPDINGGVICNDGWKESSVYYYDSIACENYDSCKYSLDYSGLVCYSENDYQGILNQKEQALNESKQSSLANGLAGSSVVSEVINSVNSQYALKLGSCRSSLNLIEAVEQQYNQCLDSRYKKEVEAYNRQVAYRKLQQIEAEKSTTEQKQLSDFVEGLEYCISIFGSNGWYDQKSNNCTCVPSYQLDSNRKCQEIKPITKPVITETTPIVTPVPDSAVIIKQKIVKKTAQVPKQVKLETQEPKREILERNTKIPIIKEQSTKIPLVQKKQGFFNKVGSFFKKLFNR